MKDRISPSDALPDSQGRSFGASRQNPAGAIMSEPDIVKYCDLMEEVKRRTAVIDFFLVGGGHALYQPPYNRISRLAVEKDAGTDCVRITRR
jgi:hypothetical protein